MWLGRQEDIPDLGPKVNRYSGKLTSRGMIK